MLVKSHERRVCLQHQLRQRHQPVLQHLPEGAATLIFADSPSEANEIPPLNIDLRFGSCACEAVYHDGRLGSGCAVKHLEEGLQQWQAARDTQGQTPETPKVQFQLWQEAGNTRPAASKGQGKRQGSG